MYAIESFVDRLGTYKRQEKREHRLEMCDWIYSQIRSCVLISLTKRLANAVHTFFDVHQVVSGEGGFVSGRESSSTIVHHLSD